MKRVRVVSGELEVPYGLFATVKLQVSGPGRFMLSLFLSRAVLELMLTDA